MNSRDRFEKLMLKSWHADGFERDSDGMYCNPSVQDDWLEWQAAIQAEHEALRAEYRALRNRLVAEITAAEEGSYEMRTAKAEARVNEFEQSFRDAIRARSQEEG